MRRVRALLIPLVVAGCGPREPVGVSIASAPVQQQATRTIEQDEALAAIRGVLPAGSPHLATARQCRFLEIPTLFPTVRVIAVGEIAASDPVWVLRFDGDLQEAVTGQRYRFATFFVDARRATFIGSYWEDALP